MTFVLKQETFEGPLDLLLQLIEAEELDITTISLARVTDQYLAYVEDLERQQMPEIADWLVIAARLLLLKSRALLPMSESEAEEDADDLAAQLAEYKLYKALAAQLGDRFEQNHFSLGKLPAQVELPREPVLEGVSLPGLHQAFNTLLEHIPEAPLATETLDEQITIEQCIHSIKTSLGKGPRAFDRLFAKLTSRLAMIITFLAILELIKQRLLKISSNQSQLMVSLRS